MSVVGIIENVQVVPVQGRDFQDVSVTVNGQIYTTKSFNVKTTGGAAALAVGTPVTIEFEKTGKYTNKIIKDAPMNTITNGAPKTFSTGTNTAPSIVDNRQVSIRLQSARNSAIMFLDVLIKSEALTKKAQKDDKLLLQLVEHYTSELFKMEERLAANPAAEVPFPDGKETTTEASGS